MTVRRHNPPTAPLRRAPSTPPISSRPRSVPTALGPFGLEPSPRCANTLLKRLGSAGLVTGRRDPSDERTLVVDRTDAGRAQRRGPNGIRPQSSTGSAGPWWMGLSMAVLEFLPLAFFAVARSPVLVTGESDDQPTHFRRGTPVDEIGARIIATH